MNYLKAFDQQGFHHVESAPEYGQIQLSVDLTPEHHHPIKIRLYVPDQTSLRTQALPRLELALSELEQLHRYLDQEQTQMKQVIIFGDALGLCLEQLKNTALSKQAATKMAIFEYASAWRFSHYGDIFADHKKK